MKHVADLTLLLVLAALLVSPAIGLTLIDYSEGTDVLSNSDSREEIVIEVLETDETTEPTETTETIFIPTNLVPFYR